MSAHYSIKSASFHHQPGFSDSSWMILASKQTAPLALVVSRARVATLGTTHPAAAVLNNNLHFFLRQRDHHSDHLSRLLYAKYLALHSCVFFMAHQARSCSTIAATLKPESTA
jgi:hypothetical protein